MVRAGIQGRLACHRPRQKLSTVETPAQVKVVGAGCIGVLRLLKEAHPSGKFLLKSLQRGFFFFRRNAFLRTDVLQKLLGYENRGSLVVGKSFGVQMVPNLCSVRAAMGAVEGRFSDRWCDASWWHELTAPVYQFI